MKLIDLDALGVGMANPAMFENRAHADGWNSLYSILQKAPVVDAVPVVRGRWYRDPTDENYFCCSVCDGANGLWHHLADCTYEFCPWCGAKMDLKEDDHAAD